MLMKKAEARRAADIRYLVSVSTSYLDDRGSADHVGRLIAGYRRPLERSQRTKGANQCYELRLLLHRARNARVLSSAESAAKIH